MSVKTFALQLKKNINEIRSTGVEVIRCDDLAEYLENVAKGPNDEPSAIELERLKADLQNWVEGNKHRHEQGLEMFRSVILSGQSAIRSAFLLNGGAAIAMLAFIGHLVREEPSYVAGFSACLLLFSFGVLAIALTAGLTYLSQWLYASPTPNCQKWGFWLNIVCIFFGFSSYLFFAVGLFFAHEQFLLFA